jgi:hypothetical protein
MSTPGVTSINDFSIYGARTRKGNETRKVSTLVHTMLLVVLVLSISFITMKLTLPFCIMSGF